MDKAISDFLKNSIINKEDANLLFQLEIDDLSPDDVLTEDYYEDFLEEVVVKTIWEYCMWRYPDYPEEQFKAVLTLCGLKILD